MSKGNYSDFKNALGYRESKNNYQVINTFGYLGKYQFGKQRLYDLGYSLDGWKPNNQKTKKILSKEDFLNDEQLQETIFDKHFNNLKKSIENKYYQFKGKIFNHNSENFALTLSGMIAVAHLLGLGGLKNFLDGDNDADGYGTKASEYAYRFSDYEV